MNRPGHPSGNPNWREVNRSCDDERQYSRKTFRSSSSTKPNPPPIGAGNSPLTQNVQSQSQTSAAFPSRIHARNTFPRPDGSRLMKSFSTSSTPNQTSVRGSQAQPSRSNPAVPAWNVLPHHTQRAFTNQPTPRRNFGHASAPSTTRGPGRKVGSGAPMWDPANEPRSLNVSRIAPSPRKRPPMEVVKSTNYPAPFWQHQDAEHEARQKVQRRLDKLGEIGPRTPLANPSSQKPRRAYLNPNFQVIQDPTSDDEDKEEDGKSTHMEVDEALPKRYPAVPGRVARKHVSSNVMAARKTKWPRRSHSKTDSEPTSSSSDSDSATSNSVIEVTDSESDEDEDEGKKTADKPPLDSEIIITEPPQPLITIPLLQVAPAAFQSTLPPSGPPEELTAALDEVCLGTLRMQQTKQLPFLLRNLRRGFRLRCKAIDVKTTRSRPKMSILVRYEYTGKKYETYISKWLCPLCQLHGALPNKEMLRCHLHWDHPEVILERWEQRTNNQGRPEWRIHLLVPEIIHEVIQPRTYDITPKIEQQEASVEPDPEVPATPIPQIHTQRQSSVTPTIFSLSPLTPLSSFRQDTQVSPQSRSVTAPSVTVESRATQSPKFDPDEFVTVKMLPPELRGTPQTGRTSTTPSYVGRSRSYRTDIQETEQLLSTVRIEHSPGPPGGIYPSPPPPHDPLGPAARAPFLPVKSEYDGPDIEYSCRPGGATTFDLLGTLPMEPFGVLDWDILEREEEIYESDDVKVELKVMHALWLRWIVLNRNEFVQNYYKGTIAFIDAYWRMIHQAAGWKALRYWLILLLTQRFLNTREVAKSLKHYENLTGMSHW